MKFRKPICSFILLLFTFLVLSTGRADAQKVAVKTNLLYAATTSPNLALEFSLGKKLTLDLATGGSLWEYKDNAKFKHWLVQPELRYWICEPFNGHFVGLHALVSEFNVGGIDLPIAKLSALKEHRYEGFAYGAGLSYGYHWILSPRWNLQLSLGAGYAYVPYTKFDCIKCGEKLEQSNYNYWGVTKASISLVYVLK